MKFRVGDKVTIKSLEEILNSGTYHTSISEDYVKFEYSHTIFNKGCMPPFCGKTFFVAYVVDESEPSYRLNIAGKLTEHSYDDVREIQNYVWNEKWLSPEQEFVLDFSGTPDERETYEA